MALGEILMHRTSKKSSEEEIITEQSSGEGITTEQKSGEETTITPQVKNVKQNMEKQQVSCLKVKCHNSKDMSHKQLNVTFSQELETKTNLIRKKLSSCKQPLVEPKLKQILKLICAAAIGVIGNSDTGFIFNNGGNTLSLKRNENIIEHNHDPILNAIEIDIDIPSESLQMNATKDYIQQLQFIETLQDDEDED